MSCYGLIYERLYDDSRTLLEVDVCCTHARTRVNNISMELDLLQVFFRMRRPSRRLYSRFVFVSFVI